MTPRLGEALAEACIWALKHHGHRAGVELRIEHDDGVVTFPVIWTVEPHPKSDSSYADHDQVAESAATILALEAIRLMTGLVGYLRSRKRTRFDYYLARTTDDDTLIFNDMVNLEVSGIFAQSRSNRVSARRNKKIKRLDAPGGPGNVGKTNVCIVELSLPWAELVLT